MIMRNRAGRASAREPGGQIDTPEWFDSSSDRVCEIPMPGRLLRQNRSQDVSRLVLHRPIALRRAKPQLMLYGIVQVTDRDARRKTPHPEIVAIILINATSSAQRTGIG
jgi:hypothetical protein